MLGLGEFSTDNFDGSPYFVLMWMMFLAATIITMLLFLNMVIAIMGISFGKVSENWERSALITRTQMYGDFIMLLYMENYNKTYLYVITPNSEDDQSEIESAFEEFKKEQKKI